MTLQEVIARFNTTPFLFAGAGITRRYYDLPGWEDLLRHFAARISQDRFIYQAYKTQAEKLDCPNGVLPMVASLIQKDFDDKWYKDPGMRSLDEMGLRMVENGVSPFKAEISAMISGSSVYNPDYAEEIKKLKSISKKNLAGVITTNYDLFFETLFEDYKSYVGQDELVFSPIQGIAEIYKIHGSVSKPNSIVINDQDYQTFNEKGKYLAAKLMTIFMEYPIIFIGYSITDPNIRTILRDIVACLPNSKFEKLQERFVFVEHKRGMQNAVVSTHSIDLDGRMLNMTKITTDNYKLLFDALGTKKAGISVKLLRRFKEEIYTYVVTSEPGPLMQVAELEDGKIDEERLCISIGLTSNTGDYGLKSIIDTNTWYRDIITNELDEFGYSYEKRLELVFPDIVIGQTGKFPVYKYLAHVDGDYPNVWSYAAKSFDDLASETNRKNRDKTVQYSSAMELWEKEGNDPVRAARLLCFLPEEKMDAEQLFDILNGIFLNDREVLTKKRSDFPTNLRRLIRFYDYLQWGKK